MRTSEEVRAEYRDLTNQYVDWLAAQDRARALDWASALEASEPDGPVFEVCVWRLLQHWEIEVRAESQAAAGPDFRCRTGDGTVFYVEATARQREALSAEMGIKDVPLPKGGSVKPWHEYHGKVWDKARQAGARPGSPVLIAYGSLHYWASDLAMDAALVDEALGTSTSVVVGGPHDGTVTVECVGGGAFAGSPEVAGILFLPSYASSAKFQAWALDRFPVRGVLNPDARAPLDPRLLPAVNWLRSEGGP